MQASLNTDDLQRVVIRVTDVTGTIIFEVPFQLNPSQITNSLPARNVFVQTLGKYPAMQGYGAGIHTVQIEGQTGYNQKGIIKYGPNYKDSNFGRAKHLQHVLETVINKARDDFHRQSGEPNQLYNIYFLNRTDEDYYRVELSPQGIQFSRSSQDPLSYYYTINMTVVGPANRSTYINAPGFENNMSVLPAKGYTSNTFNGGPFSDKSVFNRLFAHAFKDESPMNEINAVRHGLKSVATGGPLRDIANLEKQTSPLSHIPMMPALQKSALMTAVTHVPHLVHLGIHGHNPLNLKVGPSASDSLKSFWDNQMSKTINGSLPVKEARGIGKLMTPPNHLGPLGKKISEAANGISVPSLFHKGFDFHPVKNMDNALVKVPSHAFNSVKAQAGLLKDKATAPLYKGKHYFHNLYDDADPHKLATNIPRAIQRAAVTTTDNYGNVNVDPFKPEAIRKFKSHNPIAEGASEVHHAATTLADKGGVFHLEPNMYNTLNQKLSPAKIANGIKNHVIFRNRHNRVTAQVNHKEYDVSPVARVEDRLGKMFVTPDLKPKAKHIGKKADNWLQVAADKAGGLTFKPRGPLSNDDYNYYQYGKPKSHTQQEGKGYAILPNKRTDGYVGYTDLPGSDSKAPKNEVNLQRHSFTNTDPYQTSDPVNRSVQSIEPKHYNNADSTPQIVNDFNTVHKIYSNIKNRAVQYDPNKIMGQTSSKTIPTGDDNDDSND